MNSFQHENQVLALVETIGNQRCEIQSLKLEIKNLQQKLAEFQSVSKETPCKIAVVSICQDDDKMPWDE